MSDYNALFKRYMDEANYYADLYGLDARTSNTDGHWDAFRHAYASAAMTRDIAAKQTNSSTISVSSSVTSANRAFIVEIKTIGSPASASPIARVTTGVTASTVPR